MPILMQIASLLVDPNSGLPIVVLVEADGERALPIVIGLVEAEAIASALQGVQLPRPRTHDLLTTVLAEFGGTLRRIVINDLRASTFFATLDIETAGGLLVIDCRPSDAMALACRTGSPIFVAEQVLERAHIRIGDNVQRTAAKDEPVLRPLTVGGGATSHDLEQLLESLKPEDFGKYKM